MARYWTNWNQFRLTTSPVPLVVKVMKTVCVPVAVPVRVVVAVVQLCQPPVLLTGTVAMIGPVVLSRRYCTVPLIDDPDASRVRTEVAAVVPKLTEP